ncbi:MAG: hypothetical protein ACOX8W_11315 [bacterium]|jgi:hypothetical protein
MSIVILENASKETSGMGMEVREKVVVPLGYGKYVRSDKIVGMEPIEDERGPGRRTRVYIEGVPSPIIASRTENSILANMVSIPREVMEATAALELLKDIADDLRRIGPMLRTSIKQESRLDLNHIEKRIEEILQHEMDFDQVTV